MSHPSRRANPAPQWPSFKGTSQYVGTSPVAVAASYVEPSLGAPALLNAKELLADADRVVSANNTIFGASGELVNVKTSARPFPAGVRPPLRFHLRYPIRPGKTSANESECRRTRYQ
jgi:hypothetical protein